MPRPGKMGWADVDILGLDLDTLEPDLDILGLDLGTLGPDLDTPVLGVVLDPLGRIQQGNLAALGMPHVELRVAFHGDLLGTYPIKQCVLQAVWR